MSAALRRARTPLAKVLRDDDKKSFEMKKEGQPGASGMPPPTAEQAGALQAGANHLQSKGEQGSEELNPSREWVKAKFEEELERIKKEQGGAAGGARAGAAAPANRGGGLESAPVGVDSPSWGVRGRGLDGEALRRKPSDGSCSSGSSGGVGRAEHEGLRRKNSGGTAAEGLGVSGARDRRVAELERRLAVGLACCTSACSPSRADALMRTFALVLRVPVFVLGFAVDCVQTSREAEGTHERGADLTPHSHLRACMSSSRVLSSMRRVRREQRHWSRRQVQQEGTQYLC